MAQRGQPAVASGADLDHVTGLGAIGRDGKTLIAGRDQLDRTAQSPGDAGDDGRARRHRALRTEGATNIGIDDADLVCIDAELIGHGVFQTVNVLARLIDCQAVAVPHATGSEQFHRVMVLRRRFIGSSYLHFGLLECLGKVTNRGVFLELAELSLGARRSRSRRIERCEDDRRRGRGKSGFARGLKRFRQNDSDDLAFVRDLRGLQRLDRRRGIAAIAEQFWFLERFCIFVGHDVDDPVHLLRHG